MTRTAGEGDLPRCFLWPRWSYYGTTFWRWQVRKTALLLVALVIAAGAQAATVVLKGGRQVHVDAYLQRGNYVILQYADGRVESYPLAAVDLQATRVANGVAETAPKTAAPSGPHSPFYQAQAKAGAAAVTITDADVGHLEPVDDSGEVEKEEPSKGTVVLLGYDKKQIEDNVWEITATVVNRGAHPVTNLSASMVLSAKDGQTLGTGQGTASGDVPPGGQTTITARIPADGEPTQVSFDFQWQEIKPVAKPEGESGAMPPPEPAGEPAAEPPPPGFEVPEGSSPLTQPANPMAIPPLTEPPNPTAPQVPRPTPPPSAG
jgi:hypothetical protein